MKYLAILKYLALSYLWCHSRAARRIRYHSSQIDEKHKPKEAEVRKLLMLLNLQIIQKEADEIATRNLQRL